MARFYKTAEADFLQDKMYQPPIELMAQVLTNVDKQIATQEGNLLSLNDKLVAKGLDVDNPRLQEIISGFKSQIEDVTSKLQENPLEFRRQTGAVRSLGKTIADTWGSNGEVGIIQNQLATRSKYVEDLQEKVKDGKVLQADADKALMLFDAEYKMKGGVNYQGQNKYNSYKADNLTEHVDSLDYLNKFFQGWKESQIGSSYSYSDGKWVNEGTNETKYIDPKEIFTAAREAQLNNKPMMDYYTQQMQLYQRSNGGIGMSEQEVNDKITSDATILASKYGFQQTSSKQNKSADPYNLESIKHANNVSMKYLDAKLDKEFEDYKQNLENIKEIGTSSKNTFLTADQMAAHNKEYKFQITDLAKTLGLSGEVRPRDIRAKLKELEITAKANGDTSQLNAVKSAYQQLNYAGTLINKTESEASWASGINVIGSAATIAAKKDFETVLKDPRQLYGKKMAFKINGTRYNTTMNHIYNNPKIYGLSNNVFEEDGAKIDMKDIYNQGSVRPMFKSGSNNKLNTMNFDFNVNGATIEANTDFTNIGISIGN